MGIVRDFTDEAKRNLNLAIENAEKQKEGWWIFNDLWDWATDWTVNVNINDYAGDIQGYYNAIADRHDMTKAQLTQIFANVYSAEDRFMSKLSKILSQAQELKTAFINLSNILDPSPANGGDFPLSLSSDLFYEDLSQVTDGLYQYVMDQIVTYDAAGNPIYNWEAIDEILNKDPDDITEVEYYALAGIFATMSPEDTERFLQALADKTADVDEGWFTPLTIHSPQKYTEWEYNPDKIAGIQKYIDQFASLVSMQQWIVDNMTEDEISILYFQLYPDQVGQDIDFDTQKRRVWTELDAQRRNLIQQSTFLTLTKDLANQQTARESSIGLISSFEGGPLTGEEGAFGPKISLTKEGNDYILSFCNTKDNYISNMDGLTTVSINHLNENKIFISEVLTGDGAVGKVTDNMEIYYTAKYTFDFSNTAASNTGTFARDQITDAVIENLTKQMLQNATGKMATKAIGFIPVVGDIILFAVDMGVDYYKEKTEAEQNLNDINSSISALRDVNYCAYFQLDAIIISDGTANQQVIISPSPDTLNIIQNLNKFIQIEGVNPSAYGLSYPVTIEDILGNPAAVGNLIKQEMNENDRAYVFNPRH